jgi:hypothetical protein
MEPLISYGIDVSFHLPGVPCRTATGLDFNRLESWVFTRIGLYLACSIWRCATAPSALIVAE